MSSIRFNPPGICLAGAAILVGVGMLVATGNHDLMENQLSSPSMTARMKAATPLSSCDADGRIRDAGDLNCVSYFWRNELRYRVVGRDAARIFTTADPSRPHLIALIDEEGAAHISKGYARITSGFMMDLALGSVEARPLKVSESQP